MGAHLERGRDRPWTGMAAREKARSEQARGGNREEGSGEGNLETTREGKVVLSQISNIFSIL